MSRFREVIRRLHWLLGISLGLVLALMALTGATMAFEDPIMEALSWGVVDVTPRPAPRLTPDQLMARFIAQAPAGAKASSLSLRSGAGEAPAITFKEKGAAHSQTVYLDPYQGQILGRATGAEFFAQVRRLHRWLLLSGEDAGVGRKITGAAALSLVFFSISGLYLRWPKRVLDWKVWLKPNLKAKRRALYWSLHTVAGTWVLLVYLNLSLTGLTWSYGWYKAGFNRLLTGRAELTSTAPAIAGPAGTEAPGLDVAWRAAMAVEPDAVRTVITLPKPGGTTIRIRHLPRGAQHSEALDVFWVTPAGAVVSVDRYAKKPLGERIAAAPLAVHRGAFLGLPGAVIVLLAALTMPLFPLTGWLLYLDRRKAAQARRNRTARA